MAKYSPDGLLNDAAHLALCKLEASQPYHDQKNERIKKQDEAYEGILHPLSEAAQWRSQLHPPMLNHTIETALTMLVDDEKEFDIRPVAKDYSDNEWRDALAGAKAHKSLFQQQTLADHYDELERPFILQAAIRRMSVAKTFWREEKRSETSLVSKKLLPFLGPVSPVRMRETTKERTVFDGPVTEVVDLRDFYWNEAATHLDNSRWAAHAIWMSGADLMAMARDGKYDQAAVEALIRPSEENGSSSQQTPEQVDIEFEREKRGRKNGLYEVLEIWDRDTMTLHVLGGRRVLLFQGDWPYWHLDYPFVTMSLAPFPFSLQGLSLVEKLAPLQEAYWNLLNQTFDNVQLINNAIILLAADFDDPDSFEYAPGAVNTVDNPQQVQMWQPNVNLAQVAMPLLDKLQTDMQNMAMGQPISIPMAGRVTATEVATLAHIAQVAASKMKDQATYAHRRIGYHRMRLNQQFVRKTQYFIDFGFDKEPVREEVMPHLFNVTEFAFILDPSDESSVRQEKRSENTTLLTVATQAAPAFAMSHTPLNLKPFMDRVLEAYGIDNTDEFYSMQQPQGGPPQEGQQPPPAPDGAGPGGQVVGMTGPNSINPTVSPSAQQSIAPGVMAARAMALQGGGMNRGEH
jgi:hypothetical protein